MAIEIQGSFTISDGSTVTGWTERVGDWSISSNRLACASNAPGYPYISCDTPLTHSYRQFVKVHAIFASEYRYIRIPFRCNSSGVGYYASFGPGDDNISISQLDTWVSADNIASQSHSFSNTNYWAGVEVYGYGNDTVFNMWVWTSDPGAFDAAHTNWGTPTYSFTNDPVAARDTGLIVGLGCGDGDSFDYYDDFYAGSEALEVTTVVDPNSGTGYDYDSLADWESDLGNTTSGNLPADNEIAVAKCRCTGGTADTTDFNISGWSTDATHYIKIWTDPAEGYRHNGTWQTGNKYRYDGLLTTFEANLWLDGLQVTKSDSGGWATLIAFWCDGEVCTRKVSNCIIKGLVGADSDVAISDGLETVSAGSLVYIWNTLIYDFAGGSWSTGISIDDPNNQFYIYNVTIQNCQRSGIRPSNGINVICKNVLIQDCGSCFDTGTGGTFTGSNNCSDDNTQPGSNGRNGTVTFAGAADFHLSPSDTVALGYGLNLYNDALCPFQTDIDGEDRGGSGATWDIGADELFLAITQEGFRFRNDDGSETTATWLEEQDVEIYIQ